MKSVFIGFGAHVGRVDGETRCRFWTMHPFELNYDSALLVPVDLSRGVAAARAGHLAWEDVEVDEAYADGGTTSIGPFFPDGPSAGTVYLAERFWKRLRPEVRPATPPPGFMARDYELKTVVYWDGTGDARAGKRYFGFHAKILEEEGTKASVAIWHAGTSMKGVPHAGTAVVDLAAPEVSDDETAIGTGTAGLKEGALFLEAGAAHAIALDIPKLPPSLGDGISIPRRPGRLQVAMASLDEGSRAARRPIMLRKA